MNTDVNKSTIEPLIEISFDGNELVKDSEDQSFLTHLFQENKIELIYFFIKSGLYKDLNIDLNYIDKYGRTTFHYAVLSSNLKLVQALIEEKANPNIRTTKLIKMNLRDRQYEITLQPSRTSLNLVNNIKDIVKNIKENPNYSKEESDQLIRNFNEIQKTLTQRPKDSYGLFIKNTYKAHVNQLKTEAEEKVMEFLEETIKEKKKNPNAVQELNLFEFLRSSGVTEILQNYRNQKYDSKNPPGSKKMETTSSSKKEEMVEEKEQAEHDKITEKEFNDQLLEMVEESLMPAIIQKLAANNIKIVTHKLNAEVKPGINTRENSPKTVPPSHQNRPPTFPHRAGGNPFQHVSFTEQKEEKQVYWESIYSNTEWETIPGKPENTKQTVSMEIDKEPPSNKRKAEKDLNIRHLKTQHVFSSKKGGLTTFKTITNGTLQEDLIQKIDRGNIFTITREGAYLKDNIVDELCALLMEEENDDKSATASNKIISEEEQKQKAANKNKEAIKLKKDLSAACTAIKSSLFVKKKTVSVALPEEIYTKLKEKLTETNAKKPPV